MILLINAMTIFKPILIFCLILSCNAKQTEIESIPVIKLSKKDILYIKITDKDTLVQTIKSKDSLSQIISNINAAEFVYIKFGSANKFIIRYKDSSEIKGFFRDSFIKVDRIVYRMNCGLLEISS